MRDLLNSEKEYQWMKKRVKEREWESKIVSRCEAMKQMIK